MRKIAGFILWMIGWDVTGNIPENIKKSVMIVVPHTSSLDFIIGILLCWELKINAVYLIKKEFFFFPIGYILRALGAMPVDRNKGANIVTQSIDILNKKNKVTITITPEGTRKYTTNWKRGFYYIAEKASVPIVLGYLNYKDKKGGIGEVFYPTGNFEKDFKHIEDFYRKNSYAKHPEMFNMTVKE